MVDGVAGAVWTVMTPLIAGRAGTVKGDNKHDTFESDEGCCCGGSPGDPFLSNLLCTFAIAA